MINGLINVTKLRMTSQKIQQFLAVCGKPYKFEKHFELLAYIAKPPNYAEHVYEQMEMVLNGQDPGFQQKVESNVIDETSSSYKTTPRFLSLFGIRNLDELPRHEQVSYK